MIIATAARHLLRNMRGGSGGRKGGAVVLAVLAVMALGYLGVFLGRLLQSELIGRLNLGAIPTNTIAWDQPHEGNLFEHLYARRSFQRAG